MVHRTRREFLKVSAGAAAVLAASPNSLLHAAAKPKPSAWMTSKNRKFDPVDGLMWAKANSGAKNAIRLDPAQKFQSILGFGAAFTDASCYLLNGMKQDARQTLFADLFSSSGLNMSVCRTCIGASDYATKAYSFDDSADPDPELKQFSIAHDREYILPMLKFARSVNPDMFLFSSPWSPPGWMKAGGSMLGGSMRKKYFAPYAEYFVRFLQDYATDGVKISAVTIQNEVDTDQDGRMPAALWGQEYEIDFVKLHLGPALEKASLDTKIWILDHNYNLWGRAINSLSDPVLNKYVEGVAWHGYVGSADAMTKVHDAFPTKSMYWTEGGPDVFSADYATDWAKWGDVFTAALRNWSRCIVGWNLVLDERGNPNIGPFPCGGVVTLNSTSAEIAKSGQYWTFAHFSKLVRRDATVFSSQSELDKISHVAFQNPDGTHVVVITNQGPQQTVNVQLGNQGVDVALDEDSLTTLHW